MFRLLLMNVVHVIPVVQWSMVSLLFLHCFDPLFLNAFLSILSMSFVNHISFYVSYLGMNYNNVVGFLLSVTFVSQFVSGLLLTCYYSDHSILAFDSMIYIMIDVNVGWFVRFLHVVGVSAFIGLLFIHVGRGCWIRLKLVCIDSSFIIA